MRKLLSFLPAVLTLHLLAQTPYLVKDINTTYSTGTKSSAPAGFAAYGGRTFFSATTDATGTELWSTDGTSAGTSIVADIIPGTGSSNPAGMRAVNGVLLFIARDVNHGIELWTSDGSAAGTHLFLDINPGPNSAQPLGLVLYKNHMLFSADDGANGRELWTTDGTVAGTHILKDIAPGSDSSSPSSFALLGDSVYFYAAGALWKTDGSGSGTLKVADVICRNLRVAGTQLFFEGGTIDTGYELWVSDGTGAGTHMVTEILPGSTGAFDSSYSLFGMTPFGNSVLFPANDGVHGRELWISDGTAAGTHLLKDITPGTVGTWDRAYAYVTTYNGRAYFSANDAVHGTELWVTDGTEPGTVLFADLAPGTSSYPSLLTVSGDKLYFAASNDSLYEAHLWVSDGTVAGTHTLGDVYLSGTNVGTNLSSVNGRLYFSGSDVLTGGEPWVTDGTDAGTHMIANLAADGAPSANPQGLTAAGDLLFFFASEGLIDSSHVAPLSLWRTDGTDAGTFKVAGSAQTYPAITPAGPTVFFTQYDSSNNPKAMFTDGTVDGTKPADVFLQRFGGKQFASLYTIGDSVFASVYDGLTGQSDTSLWKTSVAPDGTATKLGSRNPGGLVDFAGHSLFYASVAPFSYRYGLWTTDGTPAGTWAVIPDLGDTSDRPSQFMAAAGSMFFLQDEAGNQKSQLSKTDGTADGTVAIKELPFATYSSAVLPTAGHRLYFYAGGSIWTSDGTAAGTIELTKVSFSSVDTSVAVAGDRLIFTPYTSGVGWDLWSSDGTVDGTRRLLTLGSAIPNLTGVDGTAYFVGTDADHGTEIWTTDGTLAGTKMFVDLNPGPASSNPEQFKRVGNVLYFSANTAATGRELWALPLPGSRLSIDDARATEGDSGNTSAVRFTVSLAQAASQSVTVDYATSDGTAKAGEDYDAGSGTLTFAPGETSKSVDVHVRGDVLPENNEIFFVTLKNPHGASVLRSEGAGIIDDDDQLADLGVAPFVVIGSGSPYTGVTLSNNGPRMATDLVVNVALTPSSYQQRCTVCTVPQLASGTTVQSAAATSNVSDAQIYLSATIGARQRDPQTANNVATWTVNGMMMMDAAYLNPGGSATVSTVLYLQGIGIVTSSDPSVVSVPPAVTKLSDTSGKFTVTALKPGTSLVGIQGQQYPLQVIVAAAGTLPRWPGGVAMGGDFTALPFDHPLNVTVLTNGTAPLSGAAATGTVTFMVGQQELARQTVNGSKVTFPVYLRTLNQNNYTINYSGDANFLPQTVTSSVFVHQGTAVLTGGLAAVQGAAPGTFALTVRASGSPAAAPTGTLSVFNGSANLLNIPLVAAGDGVAVAQATLTNLPASPTLTVNYLGNAYYVAGSQQIRAVASRHHLVRH